MDSPTLKILVDDEDQVLGAVSILRKSRCLYLDTEGEEIGTLNGKLSLICVGALQPDALFIFAFDVSPDRPPLPIEPLLELLSDKMIPKIMWDGRCDFVEIMDRYGISVECVLDLQIAELVSRNEVRYESPKERWERAAKRFGYRAVRTQRTLLKDIHIVIGMQQCLEESELDVRGKDPEVKELYKKFGSEVWLTRPLSKQLLDYATGDIAILAALHTDFTASGWIRVGNWKGLLEQSQRYVQSQWERGRQDLKDPFRSNAILPMEILAAIAKSSDRTQCAGCRRMLGKECFLQSPKNQRPQMRRIHCKSCFASVCFHKKASIKEQCEVWEEI